MDVKQLVWEWIIWELIGWEIIRMEVYRIGKKFQKKLTYLMKYKNKLVKFKTFHYLFGFFSN